MMDVNYSDVKDIVLKIPIFGAMSKEEVEFILGYFERKKIKKGEFIIKEGDSPENIYIILNGEISVMKDKIEIIKLQLGDSFGEIEIIGILRSIASCIATRESELIFLPKKSLYDIKKHNTELFIKLILNISRECCRRLAKNNNFFVKTLEEEESGYTDGDYY